MPSCSKVWCFSSQSASDELPTSATASDEMTCWATAAEVDGSLLSSYTVNWIGCH